MDATNIKRSPSFDVEARISDLRFLLRGSSLGRDEVEEGDVDIVSLSHLQR